MVVFGAVAAAARRCCCASLLLWRCAESLCARRSQPPSLPPNPPLTPATAPHAMRNTTSTSTKNKGALAQRGGGALPRAQEGARQGAAVRRGCDCGDAVLAVMRCCRCPRCRPPPQSDPFCSLPLLTLTPPIKNSDHALDEHTALKRVLLDVDRVRCDGGVLTGGDEHFFVRCIRSSSYPFPAFPRPPSLPTEATPPPPSTAALRAAHRLPINR